MIQHMSHTMPLLIPWWIMEWKRIALTDMYFKGRANDYAPNSVPYWWYHRLNVALEIKVVYIPMKDKKINLDRITMGYLMVQKRVVY